MVFQGWFGTVLSAWAPPSSFSVWRDLPRPRATTLTTVTPKANGLQIVGSTPEKFAAVVAEEAADWHSAIEPQQISLN